MPTVTELRVFDNSVEGDPNAGLPPQPRLILHLKNGQIVEMWELDVTPDWAKLLVAVAIKLGR
jgi:hypothetical protein